MNVYLNSGFWKHPAHEKPCQELSVNKSFYWDSEEWMIPSVYTSCHYGQPLTLNGIVIDFIKKIPAAVIRQFITKWNLHPDSDCDHLSDKNKLIIELENPFTTAFTPQAALNGLNLPHSRLSTIVYNPVYPESNNRFIMEALTHYLLDPAYGWVICRSSFLCHKNDAPEPAHTFDQTGMMPAAGTDPSAAGSPVTSLSIYLKPDKQALPGIHFHTKSPGSRITFSHPLTGIQHTLTVQEYSKQRMERTAFHSPEKIYPCCFTLLGYTIHPALSPDCFTLADCAESDSPRTLQTTPPYIDPDKYTDSGIIGGADEYTHSGIIGGAGEYTHSGIIGGADGPTALLLSNPASPDGLHYAASSLHFKPKDNVEWKIIFNECLKSEIRADLI